MSNEVTTTEQKKPITLKSLLEGDDFKSKVAQTLPKHLKPERFIRVAVAAMNRTPKLKQCTPESFFKCMIDLSSYGLEPDGRRAHLIPYGTECTLIIDYKGLAELAMRSGILKRIHADVICESDEFEYDLGEIKRHRIDFKGERGGEEEDVEEDVEGDDADDEEMDDEMDDEMMDDEFLEDDEDEDEDEDAPSTGKQSGPVGAVRVSFPSGTSLRRSVCAFVAASAGTTTSQTRRHRGHRNSKSHKPVATSRAAL